VKTENPTWAAKGDKAFWKSKTGYIARPKTGSQAELHVSQRPGLKGEVFNKYSEPTPDPFKAVHHLKPKVDIEDVPGNVARIPPHPKKDLVNNLKNIRSRETNFTDYQLYFKDGIRDAVVDVEEQGLDEPLYSSFTHSKEFDPNTWLPPHMRIYTYGDHKGLDYEPEPEIVYDEDVEGLEEMAGIVIVGPPGSVKEETETTVTLGGERTRPMTAKPGPESGRETFESNTPASKTGKQQRPMTSVPKNRALNAPVGGNKKQRPWTSGATREIKGVTKPLSLSILRPSSLKSASGVRSGAWQIIGCEPSLDVPITANLAPPSP